MNPYDVLHVRRTASSQTIQNAYRKMARKHHPDRGGDPEEFRKVKLAYDVLMDPERRARFDSTGVCEDMEPSNEVKEHAAVIIPFFNNYILSHGSIGLDVSTLDILEHIRGQIRNEIQNVRDNLRTIDKARKAWQSLSNKFEGPPEEANIFQSHIDVALRQIANGEEQNNKNMTQLERALAFVNKFTFRRDAPIKKDSRARAYIDEFGTESWELDALEPNVLIDLIRTKIESLRDEEQWNTDVEEKEKVRARLVKIAQKWRN